MPQTRCFQDLESAFVLVNDLAVSEPEFVSETRIGKANELLDLTINVKSTLDYKFKNPAISRINYDYAEQFWEFMISGGTDADEVFKKYPNVAKFIQKPKSKDLPENFNTLYGPRIAKQYKAVVEELKRSPNTRRAIMMILDDDDLQLLDKNETIEFPCTVAYNFTIREGKLIMSSIMRSQNLAVVFQLDIYLQIRLLHKIAEELGMKPEDTEWSTHIINGHVFERDFEYVRGFVRETMW